MKFGQGMYLMTLGVLRQFCLICERKNYNFLNQNLRCDVFVTSDMRYNMSAIKGKKFAFSSTTYLFLFILFLKKNI